MISEGFWSRLPRPLLALAPMEDVTDWSFRQVLASQGPPDVWFSEFANARRIVEAKPDGLNRLLFDRTLHRPMVAQIWGTDPGDYSRCVPVLRRLGFDGVDINMGCPQHSVCSKGSGAALCRDPLRAKEIALAVREAAVQPLAGAAPLAWSIKTRTGWAGHQSEQWLGGLLKLQPDALTLHARTALQQSEGQADWSQFEILRRLRQDLSPRTTILGNGDVDSPARALALLKAYPLDGVMLGRGIFGDPKLFSRIRTQLAGAADGPLTLDPVARPVWWENPVEALNLALFHSRLFLDFWGEGRNFEIMKKYFKIYLRGSPFLDTIRDRLNHESQSLTILCILEDALAALETLEPGVVG